jgi:GTP cyclohydrolase I
MAIDEAGLEKAVGDLLQALGVPLADGILEDTPGRVARMFAEIRSGYESDPREILQVTFAEEHDEMIMVKDIPLASMCEHHLVPFLGRAHVAYIPNEDGRVTGLSKIARLVEAYARRLQLQERLTTQIADALESVLAPRGVLVVVEAEHLCMSMRGVKKPGTLTVTSAVRGLFRRDASTRAEALNLIRGR